MDQEAEKLEGEIKEALNELQMMLIENVNSIKKNLSSSFSPVVFVVGLIVLIGGGLVLSMDMILLNILSLLLASIMVIGLLIVRHFSFVRAINSALEYITEGTPLKAPRSISFLEKFIAFTSPQEVYDAAVEILDEEWNPLVPVFEESIQIVHEAESEDI